MIQAYKTWWNTFLVRSLVRLPKQLRYLIASSIGALVLFLFITVPAPFHWFVAPLFGMIAYGLCWFALIEDIKKDEWYVLFVLPVVWAVLWYVSYYILPSRLFTRLLFTALFPVVYYLIISTMNIFNVGVEKGIQLYRAAQTANQFLIIVVYYLFTLLVGTFDVSWVVFGVGIGVFTFLIGTQLFWSLDPQETIPQNVRYLSLLQAIVMGYTAMLLSFLPFSMDTPRPMIITGFFYVLSGLFAMHTDEITFRYRSREYIVIFIILLISLVLTLRW